MATIIYYSSLWPIRAFVQGKTKRCSSKIYLKKKYQKNYAKEKKWKGTNEKELNATKKSIFVYNNKFQSRILLQLQELTLHKIIIINFIL